jgi:hypothetical protein
VPENIKISAKDSLGYYELEKNKPCSKLLDKRKDAKLLWLQVPSEILVYGNNLNNIRHDAMRHLRNKKREYLNDKINELATNSKNKNCRDPYRGQKEFKRGYQPRSNLVKYKNGDLLSDFHILNRWKKYFSHLLNVHRVSDVRQNEIYTPEPLVPDPSPFEVVITIAKMRSYKLPDQIPAELIQAGGETLLSEIQKLISSIWNKKQFPDLWKESIIVPIHKKGNIMGYHCYQLHTTF